uniref:alpha-amylase n=1 Tax=Alexandrium monilatum TaxID=311494 RepID=A0A7S4SDW6_9DINO
MSKLALLPLLLHALVLSSAQQQPVECLTGDEVACAAEHTALLQARRHMVGLAASSHAAAGVSKFPLDTFAGVSMYFILVDRFGRTDGNLTACGADEASNNGWCGGTLKGITAHLDYIAELGFDCIWLTPIVAQYRGTTPSGTGAMGYWAQNIYAIDEHFGTPEDYHELIEKAHEKGLCVVQDFVANHMGPIHGAKDVEPMFPFNKTEYFHQLFRGNLTFDEYTAKTGNWPPPAQAMWSQSGAQCTQGMSCMCYKAGENGEMIWDAASPCPEGMLSDFCKPGDYACQGYSEEVTQKGWFYDLGDLNQSHPFVREQQLAWIQWYVETYKIDAFRLDTAAFMAFDFLSELQEAARIPIIGEVTATNLTFHAQFQANPPPAGRPVLDGVLNFPTYFTAQAAFCGSWFPFSEGNLEFLGKRMTEQVEAGVYKRVDSLGNFADNHDVSRATASCNGDRSKTTNFVVWSMLAKGVPIVYYGTEEYFEAQREAFWTHGYNTSTYMFKVLKTLNAARKQRDLAVSDMQVKIGQRDQDKLVFTRGGDQGIWVYLNNLGETKEAVSYCGAVPPPVEGSRWLDALTGEPASFSGECFIAQGSYPKVLMAKAMAMTS